MKDHTGDVRAFHHLSEAHYGPSCLARMRAVDEVMVGFYCPDGGTSGEFCVEWIELSGKIVARLKAFDDSWHALAGFPDMMAHMADMDGQEVTPRMFCDMLLSLGIEDHTRRTCRLSDQLG